PLRGPHRRRVPTGRQRGGGRNRDDRRPPGRGSGVTGPTGPEQENPQAPLDHDPEAYAPSVAKQMAYYTRTRGNVTPTLTAAGAPPVAAVPSPWAPRSA